MATSIDRELSYRYCVRLARSHPENFFIGSLFLPRAKRQHLAAVYAYARLADDIADGDLPTGDKLAGLDCWEERLDGCLRGASMHPVFVALGATIRECDLPVEPLRDLLRAFRYDAAFRPFSTFADLLGYCRNSANPVGRLVLSLFGYRDEQLWRLSDDICTALQLTNFWQDLGVDLARGRLYVPLEDLDRFGVSRRALESGENPKPLRELVRFEVERTRGLFARGLPLAERVSRRVGREVRMFASGGLTILDRLEQGGYSPVEHRPRLTARDKLRLLTLGLVGA
ncbi:MAG TPA: squalene synthase HpnC [Candidatus Binatia bacterium]|nr:squalene synthase HpnC [Candidatus Binatia bacterium]